MARVEEGQTFVRQALTRIEDRINNLSPVRRASLPEPVCSNDLKTAPQILNARVGD